MSETAVSEARFGAYRVVEPIGSGALSTLYKAVQEPLGRVVALKALKTQIAPTSSFAEQLDRESKILGDLAHPNVVLLLDAGRTSAGRPYLVLEYIDGPSLAELLSGKKRGLRVETALAIALGIATALVHIHGRGVVHRDVKPGNVLVSREGVVKLVDFGIAHRARTPGNEGGAEGITPSGRMAPEPLKDAFGTPAYMSPEQILGDFVDERSDLFSLGVVLYQMLSGSRPFEAEGARDEPRGGASRGAASRIRQGAPARLRARAPHVPRSLEEVVMRLLEKAPSSRYASANDVVERLRRELRAITREDPVAVVHAAVSPGRVERRGQADASPPFVSVRAVLLGQLALLVAFGAVAFAIEGGREAREARATAERPLELTPDPAGGLRVLATPWAHVRVDGEDVETTPFARPIPLLVGRHWVTLSHPDAPTVERDVTIAVGEIVTLDVTMNVGGLDAGAGDAGKDGR